MPSGREILRGTLNILKQVSVEPYLFFCLLGYTIRLVSFQSLLMDSACRNTHLYSDDICNDLDNHKLQKDNSIEAGNNLYSAIMLVGSLPAIIVAVFVGPWSDKYSRKIPLMIAAFGMMLEAAMSAGLSFYVKVPPTWYVIASIFAGFSGGFILCTSAAFSYMADITDERYQDFYSKFLEYYLVFYLTNDGFDCMLFSFSTFYYCFQNQTWKQCSILHILQKCRIFGSIMITEFMTFP